MPIAKTGNERFVESEFGQYADALALEAHRIAQEIDPDLLVFPERDAFGNPFLRMQTVEFALLMRATSRVPSPT